MKRFDLVIVLAVLVLLLGCTPSGPRALLEGKRLIDEGQYPQAIQKLKAASALLGGTNALAWNYLGLAYHHAGAVAEADWAYQRALALNHDLSEVRFNLGCLRLEQNKLEAAKGEFTAYTLRRPNSPEGFLKLGTTQLRAREPSTAEKSFNAALRLNPQNVEALNGLGLSKLQRGRAAEAAQCFEGALKEQPSYPPALLNLAIVEHQYLRDHQLALEKYREYLALKPPSPNADALAAIVRQLEQELNPPGRRPATNAPPQLNSNATLAKSAATNGMRTLSAPKPDAGEARSKAVTTASPKAEPPTNVPKPAVTNLPKPAAMPASGEASKRASEALAKPAPEPPAAAPPGMPVPAEPSGSSSPAPVVAETPVAPKRSLLERVNPLNLFRSSDKTSVQPAPAETLKAAPAEADSDTATGTSPPTTPAGRYAYKHPAVPAAGDRETAQRAFAQGVLAFQEHRLPDAIRDYRLATREDPSLFQAHYNLGLAATDAGNLTLALASYEKALALQPTSLDARYNFALVLKQANYLSDAVYELEKLLSTYPNESRAHLALANLYAQQFGQPAKARPHYLKVLEIEPQHPQGAAIRYWLRDNPS